MDPWILVIILFVISLSLLIWSFYQQDTGDEFQEEFEELSIKILQDLQQIDHRVADLEQETATVPNNVTNTEKVQAVLKKYVLTLYTEGAAIPEIAIQTRLPVETVQRFVGESEKRPT